MPTLRIGSISASVISALGLSVAEGTPIFIGKSNIAHMEQRHSGDYMRYGADIANILADPDYVGQNPADDSIEYVKEYVQNAEYVKVAVRVSLSARYYARSIYVLNPKRVENYVEKGTLKRVKMR